MPSNFMRKLLIIIIIIQNCLFSIAQKTINIADYGELLDTVQKAQLFSDQKTFVDLKLLNHQTPQNILKQYQQEKAYANFNLRNFIAQHFDTTFIDTTNIIAHINLLWDQLTRIPNNEASTSTLIPLKHPYIVPGGRFREVYYWDSYFTMLGLVEAEKYELIKNILDNFSDLINQYGHIPNGNRSYYLSRSQPPFFSLMIELYANMPQTNKQQVYNTYREVLRKEYEFWMQSTSSLSLKENSLDRVVRLVNKTILNRYWDELCTPRPESFLYDFETRQNANRDTSIYSDIRAAAESGWDFSSRWFSDESQLNTIQTTHILPIDLNCLLYHQEWLLSQMFDGKEATYYENAATKRKNTILEVFWNDQQKFFFDFDFNKNEHTSTKSLAALYPLFFNIANNQMAEDVAQTIEQYFLMPGGLTTTLNNTGQQWDAPNGWAPLQWIGYKALKNYGFDHLANTIAKRWINLNVKVYFETGKMMEKYDVVNTNRKGGGGEYDLQDGFGWTNGVFIKLWNELHQH